MLQNRIFSNLFFLALNLWWCLFKGVIIFFEILSKNVGPYTYPKKYGYTYEKDIIRNSIPTKFCFATRKQTQTTSKQNQSLFKFLNWMKDTNVRMILQKRGYCKTTWRKSYTQMEKELQTLIQVILGIRRRR